MFSKVYVLFLLVVYIFHGGSCDSVPEDLLTDNQEQLEHWKQGNLIDSILNQLPFLGGSNENEQAAYDSKNSQTRESVDKKASQIASPTVPIKSIVPSPSSFGSVSTEKMSISRSSNESMSKSVIRNSTELSGTPALKPTKVLNSTSIVFSKNVSSSRHLNTTNTTVNSTTNVSLVTRVNEHASLFSHFVSTLNLSTTPLFISSSPAAHSSLMISDTAQKTISSFSTSFGNTKNTVSRVAGTNTNPSKSKSDTYASTVYPSSPTVGMPVLPDEKGYGGYVPEAIKNEKGIGFVYVNVLLPIASGVVGALLISIAILLFRCCRRRKLKKVRYFGRKQQRDFVQLDRMNLLTDTSDEEDFD